MDKKSVLQQAKEFTATYNSEGLVPFPFNETVKTLGDVKITYLATSNQEISGAIYLDSGTYTIVINSVKPINRQYFTVAHEIAHYWLHKEKLSDNALPGFIDFGTLDNISALMRADEMPANQAALQLEREANTFAAEIIMPEDKVREYFNLNGDVKDTANAFQVSVPAMAVRLEKLGLV